MPPDLKKRAMVLECEWQSCGQTRNRMDAFLLHVNEHVDLLLPEGVTAENYKNFEITPFKEELPCHWTGCSFSTTEGEVTLIRHLYFHAYHAKIKWWAKQEQSKHNFGECILGNTTRNLIPDLPEGFVCYWPDCQFYTDNAEHFYRHADNHGLIEDPVIVRGKETYPCCWEGCDSVTKTKYKLAEHLRSHTQEKRFACAECGSLFSNRAKFIDHIARQIAVELQNYQCSHCSKIFASERLLRDHMRHHVNHYKCPHCDMTCTNPSMLKAHIKWKHDDERPFECQLCEHRCKSLSALRKHHATHTPGNLIMCDEEGCEYTSYRLTTMRRHMMRCHTNEKRRPYICHVCGMQYSCGATLTRHLKVKHKFKWPSGHSRFRYKKHEDGSYRLQTVRYESLELTEQILKEKQLQQQQQQETANRSETDNSNSSSQGTEVGIRYDANCELVLECDDGETVMSKTRPEEASEKTVDGGEDFRLETVVVIPDSLVSSEAEQTAVPDSYYVVYE
ncbi:histone H4 transcription factor-like [Patiria miniata]|uniref:C2H2-type domain-containing protein n=1 Tax=Patiria miniata TaxID=46514 RepID=A0A914APA1_PATMI|nr:histone H4 transcription factor-like [Patiria miniata]XP_038065270.1 histone H4 transcription factor-like [Patiria miniata]XP_038065271.1 histone H4 transcription factor-like [Patiria miniata]